MRGCRVLVFVWASLAVPVWAHFDHGVGGERLLFEAPPSIDRPGSHGSSLDFGPSPVAHVPYTPAMDAPAGFTISAWAWIDSRVVGTSLGVAVARWHQIQGEAAFVLFSDGSDPGGFRVTWSDGSVSSVQGYDLPAGRWFHYAATVDDSTMGVFVDGKRVARAERNPGALVAVTTSPMWIGAPPEGIAFPGLIGDVRLFSAPLSSDHLLLLSRDQAVGDPAGRWLADGVGGDVETAGGYAG